MPTKVQEPKKSPKSVKKVPKMKPKSVKKIQTVKKGGGTTRKILKGVALTGATLTAAYYLNKYLKEQKLQQQLQQQQQPQIQMIEMPQQRLPPPPPPQPFFDILNKPLPPVPSKLDEGNSYTALKNIRQALNKLNMSIGDETKDNICKSYDKIINEPRKRCIAMNAYPKEQEECVNRFLKKTNEQVNLEEYKRYLKLFGC